MQQSENTVLSPNAVSMTGHRRRLWVNIEIALFLCHVFAQSNTTEPVVVLGQRRRRLTGIEPAMGFNAGPTLNRKLVCDAGPTLSHHCFNVSCLLGGLHPLYEVHCRQVLNECWPAPVMVVDGMYTRRGYNLSHED